MTLNKIVGFACLVFAGYLRINNAHAECNTFLILGIWNLKA